MPRERLFASFILDRQRNLEIALPAEKVMEATGISNPIKPLPSGVGFLAGIMRLREAVIPVINLKRRLGLPQTDYPPNAKVAVIRLFNQRFGLLFDDIKDVIRVNSETVVPLSPALQGEDRIISDIINLTDHGRVLELLNPAQLFPEGATLSEQDSEQTTDSSPTNHRYRRYVVFRCAGQSYGVRIENTRELTFFRAINELYKNDVIAGALELRGQNIPVVDAARLLLGQAPNPEEQNTSRSRILILTTDELTFGLIIDEARHILAIPEQEILPLPGGGNPCVSGVHHHPTEADIMLLDLEGLIGERQEQIRSIGRISSTSEQHQETAQTAQNVITENCYLIFTIGKHFAIELKDIQEIIESRNILSMPAAKGYESGIINLRGEVIPVVNLRHFFGYPPPADPGKPRLIICRHLKRLVALEVDSIVTIYRQEQYYTTPTLKPQFSARKDTLDRLIEFRDPASGGEHVLVVNIHNLIQNHLGNSRLGETSSSKQTDNKERENGDNQQ